MRAFACAFSVLNRRAYKEAARCRRPRWPMDMPNSRPPPDCWRSCGRRTIGWRRPRRRRSCGGSPSGLRPRFTMATAFGPEGMILIHMLAEIAPDTPIFNLDTGYQFPETLELRERVVQRYGIEVRDEAPGDDGCGVRGISTADRSTGRVRISAAAIARSGCSTKRSRGCTPGPVRFAAIRARTGLEAPIVGWDQKFELVKVSPLANWTKKDVWDMIVETRHSVQSAARQGYPSVGCWPCTRADPAGEDERAGRWSGFAKTECGLHSARD